ncbi:MAG: Hsp20/alpha crystallin family protein [Nitrospiraceae bacterium]|nr:Hsp20/alpha crystallin family protein [Nitrospiraceae bacterium]
MPKEKKEKEGGIKELAPWRAPFEISPFREMERMFEQVMGRRRFWPFAEPEEMPELPSVDVYEEGDDVVLKAELPGMAKDDIDVNITDHMLTISGEKKKEEKVEKKDYFRLERSFGSFSRSFTLPTDVQADRSKAKFKDGVLEIKIPKTEEAKKKKQKITVE